MSMLIFYASRIYCAKAITPFATLNEDDTHSVHLFQPTSSFLQSG
jgi:hypothetical protein